MNRPRSTFASGLALLALVAPVLGCGGSVSGEDASPAKGEQLLVRRGELVDRFVLTGEVDSTSSANIIVPRLPSWQTSIQWLAEDGSAVEAGDKVAELDNSTWASGLEERKLQHEMALQELAKIEAEAETTIAQQDFELTSRLSDLEKARVSAQVPKEVLSQRDWEDRQLALKKAETEADKAKTLAESVRGAAARDRANKLLEIRKLAREIELAEQAVETMILRSPESGVLVTSDHPWQGRKIRTGDVVWVGFHIARIPDLSALKIIAHLPDVDDRKISEGMAVRVMLDAFPEIELNGTIRSIAPMAQEIDWASLRRAFQVQIDLDETDPERLRPGLSARVEVIRQTLPDVLIVPRAAVDLSAEKPSVRLVGGRTVEITIAGCNALDCAVMGDLEVGARVEPARRVGSTS